MDTRFNSRTTVLFLFMLLIIGLRVIAPLMPHFDVLANFSAIGAVALFGGAYFKNKTNAILLPLAALFISDLGLVFTKGLDYGFYEGWYYTYIAFILMVVIGHFVIKTISPGRILVAVIAGVFMHWIVSDFGVWYGSTFYPQTAGGFWSCLVAAIPFERNFLYATIAYSAVMFTAFEQLRAKYPVLSGNFVSA